MHSPLTCVQHKAMQTMRNIVEAHDMDTRLLNDKTSRTRIAYLYFPVLNLILHFLPFMISTLPLKSTTLKADTTVIGDEAGDFDAFLAEMNLSDERRIDECCWYLSDMMSTTQNTNPTTTTTASPGADCFDIIDDYYFDDYDINLLIDNQSRLDDGDAMFSLYPMFDNFKLEDDLAETNEDMLGYINRLISKIYSQLNLNDYSNIIIF